MDTLLERFCRYVQVETTANEESKTYPSSPGQTELGKLLLSELQAMGLEADISEHSIVTALLPGNVDGAPTICWLAHMDTSPEAPGKGVKPQVVDYTGGDITLLNGKVIPAADLESVKGKKLVVTDGTTLLGGDDKAGVAVIMTAVHKLLQQGDRPRAPIKVLFTCDEEIGRGTDKIDVESLGAVCAYTLDGESQGLIENETFSADVAVVKITGRNIHPGLAYHKMLNAIRASADFLSRLPREMSPECTKDKEAFLHPYVLNGGVEEVTLRVLLRTFDDAVLSTQRALLHEAAKLTEKEWPGVKVDVQIQEQYRNMGNYLAKEPRAVKLADQAYRAAGIEPVYKAIRGGTDGSKLSEKGLPTPNLSAGMHNFHSVLEYACVDEMETAVKILLELASLWAQER